MNKYTVLCPHQTLLFVVDREYRDLQLDKTHIINNDGVPSPSRSIYNTILISEAQEKQRKRRWIRL